MLLTLAVIILLSALSIFLSNRAVQKAAKGKLYSHVNDLPHRHVALLLGTGKYLENGFMNLYYSYRIEAAIALLEAGKADYLVISGDNSRKDYDEPTTMKADLVAAGIDSTKIFLDYAGFRTFDSVVRLREHLARMKVFVDDVINIEPKFLGPKVLIPEL